MRCIVKAGRELAHGGVVLTGGTSVDLPDHVAYEVRHLVDQVDAAGRARPIGSVGESAELLAQLATAQEHEHVSILEQAMAANSAERAEIQKRLDEVKRSADAPAKAPEKKGTDK